ncbi:hypothetical protein [Flavobacterium sp.]|jgi:hypothetical protein|uniref:hypothetical protein n=1 Tax=Flavobacterium sp. TaxID=239 RepID=UPI0037C17941
MKKFWLHILKIIVPIFIFFLVLEIAIRKIPNDYQLKKSYLDKNASKINTLILGSSHTFYGINPKYFSKHTFNAAYVSQTLDLDEELLQIYKEKFSNLETVIIPISYASLFETLETDVEKWRLKNYILYYGFENKYRFTDNFETLNHDILLNIKKTVKFYVFDKSFITSSNLGWGTNFNSKERKKFEGQYTAKKHTVNNFKLFDGNLKNIQKIIEFCQKKNIKILFITTPTHLSYYKNLNQIQLSKTIKTINELVQKNQNCSYLNLLKSDKFITADFYDADHLNDIGAKKLSLLLDKKINSR